LILPPWNDDAYLLIERSDDLMWRVIRGFVALDVGTGALRFPKPKKMGVPRLCLG
jgi:hypothetical protein